ncbi:MAG: DUF6788 family protein [Anaerolineae bacterium]|jgi:hypothetical protein
MPVTKKGLVPMTNKRLSQIERRIEMIKVELTEMGEMRPGSLTRQYKDPENQSGPYYQLSYTLDMKSRTDYIRRECVSDIRRQIRNYKRFKKLSGEWIALSIEHSRLTMKLARNQ